MLHFLRPEWLLALLPVLVLLIFIFKQKLQQGSWQTIIDPKFQQVLLDEQQQQKQTYLPLIGLAIIWLGSVMALAGPSWQQIKQPSEKIQQGTVILLDNSLSMLAEDIKPNRITRARYKLIDFLTANPHLSTGLVVYSGSAHSLSPISDDNQTILSLLPNINPTIMPSYGSDAQQGLSKAIQLLKQSRIKRGHIIWLLDDVDQAEISPLKSQLADSDITLTLLAVGTKKGAPISVFEHGFIKDKQGRIVIAKLGDNNIRELANELGATLLYLQNDNSDIKQLSQRFSIHNQKAKQQDNTDKEKNIFHWLDKGIYLLLPLVLMIGLAFRRGWLVSSILIGFIMLPPFALYTPNTFAEDANQDQFQPTPNKKPQVDFLDFFKSPNQQGYELWQQKDYQNAIDRFSSANWKASSHFRLKEFAQAQKQFELDKSPTGHFNQGNALAKQGQYADAKEQYEQALKLQPDFADATKNLAIIKKIIALEQQKKKQEQEQQNQPQKPNKNGQEKEQEKKQEPNQPGKQSSEKPNSSDQDNQENNKNKQSKTKEEGQKENDPKDPADDTTKEGEKSDSKAEPKTEKASSTGQTAEKKQLSEEQQAKKAWLNQIPDDPGFFLKNKFEYQYQQHQKSNSQDNKGKIW